jgi:hypothetical protein
MIIYGGQAMWKGYITYCKRYGKKTKCLTNEKMQRLFLPTRKGISSFMTFGGE